MYQSHLDALVAAWNDGDLDGVDAFERVHFDALGMMTQLGLIEMPEG